MKLTLDQAWELCLKQWRWIVKQIRAGSQERIGALKEDWIRVYSPKFTPEHDCFFCEYNYQKNGSMLSGRSGLCNKCPGNKIDKYFRCQDTFYDWRYSPLKFYAKLLELNRLRKKGKKK